MADSLLIDISEAVLAAIVDKRDNATPWPSKSRWSASPGFVKSAFEAERSWLPYQNLEEFPEGGKVWVIGLASDDERTDSRANTSKRLLPVQVALQVQVADPLKAANVDPWVTLYDQIREVCRLEVDPDQETFSWMNTAALKDPNDTPYAFMALREGGFFEAYFTAFYLHVQP